MIAVLSVLYLSFGGEPKATPEGFEHSGCEKSVAALALSNTDYPKQAGDNGLHHSKRLQTVSSHRRGRLALDPEAVAAFQTLQRDPDSPGSREDLGEFTVTAYALTVGSTGKSPGQPGFGITASGSKASVGRTVAVDPDVIPIGSLVYIDLPGIGWRLAEDIGGAIKGHHIDLLLPSDSAAIQFGIKHGVHIYAMSK
jgi:3D (Asp-Asp-Asp) domain-containing protein